MSRWVPVLLLFFAFSAPAFAQVPDKPGGGKLHFGIGHRFVRDRDIQPQSAIGGWIKGEIDRSQSTLLEASYGLSENATIRAFFGYTSVDIKPVKTNGFCDYATNCNGLTWGIGWKFLYYEWDMFLLWSEIEYSRHQFKKDVYIDEWQAAPLMLGIKWKGFFPYLGWAYSDFRIRDHAWRFRSEELWAVILGLRWTFMEYFSVEIRGDFIPEMENRDVGNSNGFDGYNFTLKAGLSF